MPEEFDVIVVGAGPAGSRAAIEAAKGGATTLLLEEHPVIGQPIACGEGISRHGLDFFDLPAEDAPYYNLSVKEFKMFAPNGSVVKLHIDGFMIHRDKFDQYNAKLAEEAGADVRTSHRVENARRENNQILVEVLKENKNRVEFTGKIVIDATGPSARVGRMLGRPVPEKRVYGIEYKMRGVSTDSFDFYLDFKKFPRGYTWVFPKGNDVSNVGIVMDGPRAKERLNEFIKEQKIEGEIIDYIGGTIPMTGPIYDAVDDNFIAAGDANGTANALFYGGNRIAMTSGMLAGMVAAKAIKEGNVSKERLKEFDSLTRSYPFADPSILEAHRIFYAFKNETYNRFSKALNGVYLDKLGITGRLKIFKLWLFDKEARRMTPELKRMVKGFKITSVWGF